MAISFVSGSLTLANYGISAGDIAVFAGAGRNAVTWMMAQMKDRNLLDFMHADPEHIISRRGILDPMESHRRWNKKITLLQNGKKVTLKHTGGREEPLLENMDRFTWFMTFVVAALDAAVSTSLLNEVISDLLTRLFSDSLLGLEFLERELRQHIQGWQSGACVRGILQQARVVWSLFEAEGLHYPGLAPDAEAPEIERFLGWLCGRDSENSFYTASSDVFCIAKILENIGMYFRCRASPDEPGQDEVCVIYDASLVSNTNIDRTQTLNRTGMRFPLDSVHELCSIWPPPLTSIRADHWQGELRELFERVQLAVRKAELHLVFRARRESSLAVPIGHRLIYEVLDNEQHVGHRQPGIVRLAGTLLLFSSPGVLKVLESVVETMCERDRSIVMQYETGITVFNQLNMVSVQKIQVFLLAYCYAILLPLIDASQLSIKEGFGSYNWCDFSLFALLEGIRARCGVPGLMPKDWDKPTLSHWSVCIMREDILRLVAYLFGGASYEQVSSVSGSTVGVIGKYLTFTSTLVASPMRNEDLGKVHLLDVDGSTVPSNLRGLVTATGLRNPNFDTTAKESEIVDLRELTLPAALPLKDFTMHIEPDWQGDTQNCLLTHRHEGRLVYRVNVLDKLETLHHLFVEQGLSAQQKNLYRPASISNSPDEVRFKVRRINLATFHGWQFPIALHTSQSGSSIDSSYGGFLLVAPACPNAISCIVAMAHGNDVDFALVQSVEEAVAMARNSKFQGYYLMVGETALGQDDLTTSCQLDDFYSIGTILKPLTGSAWSKIAGGFY
jgi:hypothetical protein